MKRRIHRFACSLLTLIALSLTGAATQCSWTSLTVEIPDLEANQIAGLQLWRAEEEMSQSLTEAGQIIFHECVFQNGLELLDFTMLNTEGEPIEVLGSAVVTRREEESGAVTLHFSIANWSVPPGWIRVTTFNEVGESDLSDEAVFL